MPLNAQKFGFALGVAGGVFYLGCVILMTLSGTEGIVFWFNSVFHGLDVSLIINKHPGVSSTIFGLINTVVISWLFGGLIAVVYNLSLPKT